MDRRPHRALEAAGVAFRADEVRPETGDWRIDRKTWSSGASAIEYCRMSPTTPTIGIHVNLSWSVSTWIRLPTGSSPGQTCRAMWSLMTATIGASDRSESARARPRSTGTPIVVK